MCHLVEKIVCRMQSQHRVQRLGFACASMHLHDLIARSSKLLEKKLIRRCLAALSSVNFNRDKIIVWPPEGLEAGRTGKEKPLMKLSPGKLKGMQAVSDARGIIAAAAMDQRGSLEKSLARESGKPVAPAMMEEFKSAVTRLLTPHASAILLDPE